MQVTQFEIQAVVVAQVPSSTGRHLDALMALQAAVVAVAVKVVSRNTASYTKKRLYCQTSH
jgi:hypothetical protein